MARRSKKQKLSQETFPAVIESLSHEGRGVAHINGKATFISGALPGEKVSFIYTSKNRKHDEGQIKSIIESSPDRVEPKCKYYGHCGGCSLQHLSSEAQIKYKQQSMLDSLKHIANIETEEIFAPIVGDTWAYRRKARLGVRFSHKKSKVIVGFRGQKDNILVDISSCDVLHESIGNKIDKLQSLISNMDSRDFVSHIEVAIGDENVSLVIRHLKPLSEQDKSAWIAFAKKYDVQIYLQPKGLDSVHCIWPELDMLKTLYYEHASFKTKVEFGPQDFFQVNNSINVQMVPRAVELLKLTGEERVLDLFCGLGNFTLPIAKQAAHVTGVEGNIDMVNRARETALANGIRNTDYYACNLMIDDAKELKREPWLKQKYDCILLDPPRSGAKEVIEHFGRLKAKRIVYVSCHPATLARDSGQLVSQHGYELLGAGVMDMFPQTSHVESIAVFGK